MVIKVLCSAQSDVTTRPGAWLSASHAISRRGHAHGFLLAMRVASSSPASLPKPPAHALDFPTGGHPRTSPLATSFLPAAARVPAERGMALPERGQAVGPG
eukprot:1156674-Pelagomonas_calceolata.AAC.21